MEEFCSSVPGDMNNDSKRRSAVESTSTEHKGESEVSTQSGGIFVVTTTIIVMNNESKTSSEVVSTSTVHKVESEVSTKSGGTFILTTTLIVTGVLLVCAIGGGIILVKVVKRRRNELKRPEYCDVYVPRASNARINTYEEVGAEASSISAQSYTDVSSTAVRQQDSLT